MLYIPESTVAGKCQLQMNSEDEHKEKDEEKVG